MQCDLSKAYELAARVEYLLFLALSTWYNTDTFILSLLIKLLW